jgi:hypothetical protein
MDHPAHGVQATVIDLGLARMNACGDGGLTEIRWTPFDEEIFEGEGQRVAFDALGRFLICILGDYQFDIYRLMRKHNGGRWADFRPLTNVMVCPCYLIDRIAFQQHIQLLLVVALLALQVTQVQELAPAEKVRYCNSEPRVHGTKVLRLSPRNGRPARTERAGSANTQTSD